MIHPDTHVYSPTNEQTTHWESVTGVPFDPTVFRIDEPDVALPCPACSAVCTIPWENSGYGIGEAKFNQVCAGCGSSLTHDRLCVAKFLRCLREVASSDTAIIPYVYEAVLPLIDLLILKT
jgi:hypothetical protein